MTAVVPKTRGRPEYEPTEDERQKVKVLAATGMSEVSIAEAIGIGRNTLRKHFSEQILRGRAKVVADVTMARYRAAMGGSVPAQNKLLEQLGALPPRPTREPKPEPLGKKEAAQIEAETAHEESDWGRLLQ